MIEISIFIGITAGIIGIAGFAYQSYKNPTGMTWPMIMFAGVSIGTWAAYGITLGNPILYVTNIVLVLLLAYNAVMKLPKPIYPGLDGDSL